MHRNNFSILQLVVIRQDLFKISCRQNKITVQPHQRAYQASKIRQQAHTSSRSDIDRSDYGLWKLATGLHGWFHHVSASIPNESLDASLFPSFSQLKEKVARVSHLHTDNSLAPGKYQNAHTWEDFLSYSIREIYADT